MSDYELTLKIRNAPLLNLMRNNGYETAADLSRDCDVTPSEVGRILNLKDTMNYKDGTVRTSVKKISEFFKCLPEDIFPYENRNKKIETNEFKRQVTLFQLEQLTNMSTQNPSNLLEVMRTEGNDTFSDMLDFREITNRQKFILKSRFEDGKTFKEIGKDLGITGARVIEIQNQAIRKLRNARNRKAVINRAGTYADYLSEWL